MFMSVLTYTVKCICYVYIFFKYNFSLCTVFSLLFVYSFNCITFGCERVLVSNNISNVRKQYI